MSDSARSEMDTGHSSGGVDHHLSEAQRHLREARKGEIHDDHVAESIDNAVTETIVALERHRLVRTDTDQEGA